MANFNQAFEKMISHEGGYADDPDDSGGETYKGISRNNFPNWSGWEVIDSFKTATNFPGILDSSVGLHSLVESFYKFNFWIPINGDQIASQKIAESIFDFGVNAGVGTSAKLAQKVVGIPDPDGAIGKNTIAKLNIFDPELFIAAFMVEKVRRYIEICKKKESNRKYFFGWIDRTVNP